ncbi:MAG: bifunctional N-acetylglucosamine-1-phosphate uridyltransferase/glucosamine-1-phosphate acetyltransferase [Candidatus Omnitrophica bacterium]|nr:bifunctional N-acetylglucosamine-1-phosphate uridyltransferase/glucosamine-1-phosphate acetyltransferase [Candidatus Omnitrophota bacterium]
MKCIILAAGKGVRMKSEVPKPLHPIHSRSMLAHLIHTVNKAGIKVSNIVLVLGHGADKIKKVFENFNFAYQAKQLGSGNAVQCARKYLKGYNGDVLILYSDTPLLKKDTLIKLVKTHKKTKSRCTILTAEIDKPDGYGRVIRNDKKEIEKIVEEKDASSKQKKDMHEINVGAYVFKKETLFSYLKKVKLNLRKKEYYLTDIINILQKSKIPIESVLTEDQTEALGINSKAELEKASCILKEGNLETFMEKGVSIADSGTTHIDYEAIIGKDTFIYPHTVIEEDVEIGKNCKIGPFAHLRPGTRIGSNVEIGNFVELVRTEVGNNCKIKHLTYLGDARVGRNVNVGAGVITANYDGKKKNKTIIGDNVFIGVGAILIAPVKIGKGALVGAGSVVTKGKNVPPRGTVIGVPARPFHKK